MSTSPNNSDTEWLLELEESAQGTDLYEAPGGQAQMETAIEDTADTADLSAEGTATTTLVGMARIKRRSLAESMRALETSISRATPSQGWAEDVRASIHAVRDAFHQHIVVTEGSQGLLAEIVDLAPRLSGEAVLIEQEHQSLEDSLRSLERAIGSEPEAIRRKATVVLGRLTLHRQRGADIVYEAYNVDIATAD